MSTEEIAFRKVVLGNLEKIEFAYQRALEDGLTDLVVLVIDLRDRRGKQMAESLSSKEEVFRRLEKGNASGLDLWLIQPIARNEVASFLASFIPPDALDVSFLSTPLTGGEFIIGIFACNMLGWTTHRIPD